MADPLLIALPTHRYLYGDQIHTRHVKLFPLLCYIRPSQFFTIDPIQQEAHLSQ